MAAPTTPAWRAIGSPRPATWRRSPALPSGFLGIACRTSNRSAWRRLSASGPRLPGVARNTGRIGAGILIGSLLAMGATVAQRELMRRAGTRLIDWEAVRGIARRRLGPHATPLSASERAEALAFYQQALTAIEPLVEAEVGRPLPQALETPAVIDRLEWIELNLATFRG